MDNKKEKNAESSRSKGASDAKPAGPMAGKKGLIIGLVLLLGLGIWGLVYFIQSGQVVAYISDGKSTQKITKDEYTFFLEGVKTDMLNKAGKGESSAEEKKAFWESTVEGENAAVLARKKALESAKEFKIQLVKAKQKGITLSKEEIDATNESIRAMVAQFGGENNVNTELRKYGVANIAQFKEFTNQRELIGKLIQQETGQVQSGEEDLKKYYEENKDEIFISENNEDRVWVRHILFLTVDDSGNELSKDKQDAAAKAAEDALRRAKNGEDFATLARQLSQDQGSKDNGGQYVFGKGVMDPAFEQTSFALSPGAISDPVKTTHGYHIIKLEEKIPAGKPISYKGAKEYYQLEIVYKNSKYQDTVEKWKNEFTVKLNERVYNTLQVNQ